MRGSGPLVHTGESILGLEHLDPVLEALPVEKLVHHAIFYALLLVELADQGGLEVQGRFGDRPEVLPGVQAHVLDLGELKYVAKDRQHLWI